MITLQFFRGRNNNIVAKLSSGKIALIDRNSPLLPKEGERWECELVFEKQKFVVVRPIRRCVRKFIAKCGCLIYEHPHNEYKEVHEDKYCKKHARRITYKCGHELMDNKQTGSENRDELCEQCKVELELQQFFVKVREIAENITPEPEYKRYQSTWYEEAKKLIEDIRRTGKLRQETHTYYHEGDGYLDGWRQETTRYYIKDGIRVPEEANWDIVDTKLWIQELPKEHWIRELMEQERAEEERVRTRNRQLREQWLRENQEWFEEISRLYNELSEKARDRLRYKIDPYDGLFGEEPDAILILKEVKKNEEKNNFERRLDRGASQQTSNFQSQRDC
jgi:hypothetical protein